MRLDGVGRTGIEGEEAGLHVRDDGDRLRFDVDAGDIEDTAEIGLHGIAVLRQPLCDETLDPPHQELGLAGSRAGDDDLIAIGPTQRLWPLLRRDPGLSHLTRRWYVYAAEARGELCSETSSASIPNARR